MCPIFSFLQVNSDKNAKKISRRVQGDEEERGFTMEVYELHSRFSEFNVMYCKCIFCPSLNVDLSEFNCEIFYL